MKAYLLTLLASVLAISCGASVETGGRPGYTGTALDVDVHRHVYVVDAVKGTLRMLGPDLQLLREVGGPGWQSGEFDRPAGIWARNGIDVFVADYGNHRIQRFDRNLSFISSFSTRESPNADERFGFPTDVALSRLGDLFICDTENSRIIKVNRFSRVERSFGGFDAGRGRLTNPTRIDVGAQDFVYVIDGNRIAVFDNFGNYLSELTGETGFTPLALYADQNGLVVVAAEALHYFDRDNRFLGMEALAQAGGAPPAAALAVAVSRGSIYLLTTQGLVVLKDAREKLLQPVDESTGKQ
jgi:DNA-binding beta-propeller fold protein YncE